MACARGAVEIVQYLVEVRAHLVGERDGDGKLPIQLLVESGVDHESADFVGAVWRLLREFPETVFDMKLS